MDPRNTQTMYVSHVCYSGEAYVQGNCSISVVLVLPDPNVCPLYSTEAA